MILSFLLTLALNSASPSGLPSPTGKTCIAPLPLVTLVAPKSRIAVEVASTERERENGLMNRHSMPQHHGMVFVFENDSPVEFWMKNTLIPLDMVFIGKDGVVRRVEANVPVVAPDTPDDVIPRRSGTAKYVVELNAGEAARDGIEPGVKLRPFPLPVFREAAAGHRGAAEPGPGNLICW